MCSDELRMLLIKAAEMIDNNPEYIISEPGDELICSDNAPYEVIEYCKYMNKINSRISNYYKGDEN